MPGHLFFMKNLKYHIFYKIALLNGKYIFSSSNFSTKKVRKNIDKSKKKKSILV